MAKLTYKTNVKQYINTKLKEEKQRIGRAMVIANKRSAQVGVTEIKKLMAEDYNVKKSVINKDVKSYYGNYANPSAKIVATGKGIALKNFGVRPANYKSTKGIQVERRKKLTVEVTKSNRVELNNAFLVPTGTSFNIFERQKGGTKLVKLYGPGAAIYLGLNKTQRSLARLVKSKYKAYYESAYEWANKNK